MKKISVLILILCFLFTSLDITIIKTVKATGETYIQDTLNMKSGKNYIVLTADSFKNHMGNWTNPTNISGSLLPKIMLGATDVKDHSTTPAIAKYGIPTDGIYKVMVHSRDFTVKGGTRPFKIKLANGDPTIFGTHGTEGWKWENGAPLPMHKGEYDLQAIDYTGNYARFDMIVITDDLDFTIEDTPANLSKLTSQYLYVPGSVSTGNDPNRPGDEFVVKFNGQYMMFDAPPISLNSQILVPYENIFEALGCTTQWDEDNQTIAGTRNGKVIRLTVGSSIAKINGKGVPLDQPPVIVNNRVFVPVKFVSETFGASVAWYEGTKSLSIIAIIPKPAFLFRPDSFQETGTWTLEANISGAFDGSAIRGMIPSDANAAPDPSITKPAISTFNVSKEGQYKLWVRSRDFATNQQGSRFFKAGINGNMIDKTFGTHGKTGFFWVEGGVVDLKKGENTLELYDTSGFYARCDAVLLTEDLNYIPAENYTEILSIASPFNSNADFDISFPQWALTNAEPSDSMTIENGSAMVVFYKVNSSKGQVVQSEIYSKDEGNWIKTKNRTEELGYLVLAANKAEPATPSQDFYVFKTQRTLSGKTSSYLGVDVYKSGAPEWFIPVDYEKLSDNKVKLKFNNPLADFSAVWELDGDDKAPKVSVDATFRKEGYYSIGAWEGGEFFDNQYDFALASFRVQGKRIREEAGLLPEQYMSTPMGTITLSKDNKYAPGKKVTKGIAVEPSWIPLRWVYSNNGKFGIDMRSTAYAAKGSVFAPVFGSENSRFEAGQSYNLQYRVISQVSDWFDAYKFVAQDLYGLRDYRQNTYSTLNDAIFNTRKLILNDELGGWDVYDKAHYNMEGKNVTSSANPMQALQDYLLTENKDMLTRRTIPTIANFLTRGDLHFNRTPVTGGADYWPKDGLPKSIGSPIAGYNLNVVGGMYEMTRGAIPYLYKYGLEKGKSGITNSYGSIPDFSNNLYLYKYTGNSQYLDKAKEQADKFLAEVVYKPQTKTIGWSTFVYISYYPNVASLVDLYEFTKEEKYLNAAKYAAEWLSTTLWVPGIDSGKVNQTVVANDLDEIRKNFHYNKENNSSFWWHGDEQYRIGTPYGDPGNLDNNKIISSQTGEVPSWIPSRVGLGLEQASTFWKSANIIMSSWVGDLLKLSKYTGEKLFADEARNAIIGRFSTYSGYYQNTFITYQQKPEYSKKGPDYTGIYWHHLPPFLAMLEDFLINMTSTWSNDNIQFPSLRQQGYAYFNSNQYGFAPGKFFDESDMWLWLDEGIADSGNLQIDWLAARKDGVLGLALMNESDEDITTEVTIGEKVPGGKDFSGKAVIYAADKSKTEVDVMNGKFTVTIPGKSLRAAVMKISGIEAPAYSKMKYTLDGNPQLGQTVAEHKNGKAMVLQMTPQNYYAYVYITDKPDTVKELTIKYKIGGGKEKIEKTSVYPYEFIIEVPNSKKDFEYELEITKTDGTVEKIDGNTISPLNQNTSDDESADNP